MRVDITFDRQKVERQGYPLAAVQETVKQNFEVRGLRCIQEEIHSPSQAAAAGMTLLICGRSSWDCCGRIGSPPWPPPVFGRMTTVRGKMCCPRRGRSGTGG